MKIEFFCLLIYFVSTSNSKQSEFVMSDENAKLPIYEFHFRPGFKPITTRSTKKPMELPKYETEFFNDGNGNFKWQYSDENSAVTQTGHLLNQEQIMAGSYWYTAADGDIVRVNYIADSNGYQPQGNHLPRPVKLPPEYFEAVERFNKVAAELEAIGNGLKPNTEEESVPDADIKDDKIPPVKIPPQLQFPLPFIPQELPHATKLRKSDGSRF